ncbi:MAG TPA: FtsX-like permease family protein [Dokdonella sp.]|uniref:ABC transporter permease n=1 Tax=Dokdonella sp. TaxID=2291710 RepID=UPI0025BC9023|nr:FtsX-like permease family protein [Dokdonella sp.]MBX3692309.1 FtsX-like permease family protein [Dokdonella sp.]MCW5567808.1 FtsX-like permease family protein [Dokdonella sp.]HNR92661.1 FtsX-like permease family protein [Dokdonella sp.]
MKYFHLVWAALFRRKTRTTLTLLSVMAAFVLFGLLDSVRVAFNSGGEAAGVDRMVVASRFSIIQSLPQSLLPRIEATPGVKVVTWANWFGGYYKDPKNQGFNIAIGSNYFDVYPEIAIAPEVRAAFERTRTGAIVGEALAKRFGWKAGDKVVVTGAIFPDRASGETTWTFDLVGTFSVKEEKLRGIEQQLYFRWDYFDEANAYGSGQVGWIILRVTDPAQSDSVAKAIDALSANSDHETKTQTEQAFSLSFAKQLGDIGLIVSAIMAAVFFTLLLLTGNTMAQAVRERIPELATLKTMGFSDRSVLGLVFAEAVLLIVLGGVLGLGLVAMILPALEAASGGMLQLPPVGARTWGVGIAVMLAIGLLVGVLPALRAMRLKIVDALAGR